MEILQYINKKMREKKKTLWNSSFIDCNFKYLFYLNSSKGSNDFFFFLTKKSNFNHKDQRYVKKTLR